MFVPEANLGSVRNPAKASVLPSCDKKLICFFLNLKVCQSEVAELSAKTHSPQFPLVSSRCFKTTAWHSRVSCRELFEKFNILSRASEYVVPLLVFSLRTLEEISNKFRNKQYKYIHNHDFPVPSDNLTMYIVACLALPYFFTLSNKRADFQKKILNTKCAFRFSLKLLSETISHSRKNSARYYDKCAYVFM